MTTPPRSDDLCPVMLFSGKGGVGKTTLAAATAVKLAREGSRVLIVSTDPAHSLADALDTLLGQAPRAVIPGLDAMEIDATAMFGAAAGAVADEAAGPLAGLMKMASETPGVDEFAAVEVLLQAMESARHDVVILDTAPTGHTLRLLALPELLDGWLGTLISLRERIAKAGRVLRKLVPGGRTADAEALAAEFGSSRARIAALREVLADPDRAQIVLVTIPEPMSVAETSRTLEMLRGNALAVGTVVVNQVQPESRGCPHCERRRAIHLAQLRVVRERAGEVPVRVVESLPRDIRGPEALGELAALLWRGEAGA